MESTWITVLVDDHNSVVAFCLQFRDAETKPDLHPLNPWRNPSAPGVPAEFVRFL